MFFSLVPLPNTSNFVILKGNLDAVLKQKISEYQKENSKVFNAILLKIRLKNDGENMNSLGRICSRHKWRSLEKNFAIEIRFN